MELIGTKYANSWDYSFHKETFRFELLSFCSLHCFIFKSLLPNFSTLNLQLQGSDIAETKTDPGSLKNGRDGDQGNTGKAGKETAGEGQGAAIGTPLRKIRRRLAWVKVSEQTF